MRQWSKGLVLSIFFLFFSMCELSARIIVNESESEFGLITPKSGI